MNDLQVVNRIIENAVPIKFILTAIAAFIVGWKSHGKSHGTAAH